MPASAGTDGSPAITWVPPLTCVHRSHVPPFWLAWLNSDCAMSLPVPGWSRVTSCSCERYTSQPEKLAYCARCRPVTRCVCWSKPRYSPFASLNTLGCNRAW